MFLYRLLPTAPCVARILENKTEINDFTLPSGVSRRTKIDFSFWCTDSSISASSFTKINDFSFQQSVILCHTWLACLRESNFEKATEFLPERWLNDSSCKSSILVIPFGYGRRMCPGKRFVELELQVVLARVRLPTCSYLLNIRYLKILTDAFFCFQLIQNFEVNFVGDLQLEFEFLLAPAPSTNFIFKNRLW